MPISRIETASLDSALVAPTATALTTASGSAPSYSARAWVNFNGTGTVAIRASGNVSSITDNNVGNYTVNFATAMPDVNFAVNMTYGQTTSAPDARWGGAGANSTTTAVIYVIDSNGSLMDRANIYVSVFR